MPNPSDVPSHGLAPAQDGPGSDEATVERGAEADDDGNGDVTGRVAKVRLVATQAKDTAEEWRLRVEAERPRQPIIDTGFEVYERDTGAGGSLLAGAIAFRLFLVAIPWGLVLLAVLGFIQSAGGDRASEFAKEVVTSPTTSSSLTTAAKFAEDSRWTALTVGLFALVVASRSLVKALRITHSLAWGTRLRRAGVVRPVLGAVGLLVAITVAAFGSSWMRSRIPGYGLTAAVILGIFWTLVWLLVERLLPRAEGAPWYFLVPGALVVGIGTQCLHAFTVFYLAGRIEKMSSTYGPLGIATVMMLWLFILGRVDGRLRHVERHPLRPSPTRRRAVASLVPERGCPAGALVHPRRMTQRNRLIRSTTWSSSSVVLR